MDSNDIEVCGKKCYYWFHSEVKVLTRFLRLFGLSHFFILDFYAVKSFICISFV